jgi:hypothetical protein
VSSTRSIQREETTGSTSQSHVISDAAATKEKVLWPVDLLSKDGGKARILTFGYDNKVTKYTSGPTNKNGITRDPFEYYQQDPGGFSPSAGYGISEIAVSEHG